MMHSWDMHQNTKFMLNWCNNTMPIKTEPQDMNVYKTSEPKRLLTESNPTSPQSMDSENNLSPDAANYSEQIHGLTNLHAQSIQRPFGFNPLTPPGYPNPNISTSNIGLSQSKSNVSQKNLSTPYQNIVKTETNLFPLSGTSLTPSHTPPMDDTPPKSPKYLDETPEKDEDNTSNSGDDIRSVESYCEEIRTPKVNSHGKVKQFKCKQCEFVAVTKVSFWEHTKTHIKMEKMLTCTKCPFVTEYKHHLEYHLRNHDGSKPFRCTRCNYSCVNKSMLNSHLKSHSTIYQYRCETCEYATKYCHSLKLHLRRYKHKPAMVLNEDGSPNPLPVIDVYGTRRGPKNRSSQKQQTNQQTKQNNVVSQLSQQSIAATMQQPNRMQRNVTQQQDQEEQQQQRQQYQQQQQQQQLQSLIPSMMPNPFNMMSNPFNFPYLNFNFQMLAAQQQAALAQLSPTMDDSKSDCSNEDHEDDVHDTDDDDNLENKFNDVQMHEKNNNGKSDINEPPSSPIAESESSNDKQETIKLNYNFECKYCEIGFKDAVLHTIHMGYHGYNDIFKCNMCGEKCDDRVSFFLHIARNSHS